MLRAWMVEMLLTASLVHKGSYLQFFVIYFLYIVKTANYLLLTAVNTLIKL